MDATVLYSLVGPFLVWPLEFFFPYPFIVEELFKSIVVYFGGKNYKTYLYAGIVFALTETVLYSININASGKLSLLFVRFLTSAVLHSVTFLIIFWFAKRDRKLVFVGFIVSALIHYLYNRYVPIY